MDSNYRHTHRQSPRARRLRAREFALALGALAAALPSEAQRLGDTRSAFAPTSTAPTYRALVIAPADSGINGMRTAAMIGAGIAFGVGGALLGGYAGGHAEDCRNGGDFCGLAGAVVGGILGETIALPIGVHFAGGLKGNLSREIAGSLVIAFGGTILAFPTSGLALLAVPPLQLWTSIREERRGARRRLRQSSP